MEDKNIQTERKEKVNYTSQMQSVIYWVWPNSCFCQTEGRISDVLHLALHLVVIYSLFCHCKLDHPLPL